MAGEAGGQIYMGERGQVVIFAGKRGDKYIEIKGDKL